MKTAAPLTVVLTQLPPAVCGIGDYTMNLIQAWPEERSFQFIITRGTEASQQTLPQYRIEGTTSDAQGLASALDKLKADDVFVQYSGFGFDPKGCPAWMPHVFAAWKRQNPKRRLAIMFHELWTKWPWWDPRSLRSWKHRRSIAALLKLVDAIYTNTEGYASWLRALKPHVPVQVVPVGSNVALQKAPASVSEREKGLMVVFGKQGTRLLALRTLKDDLVRLSEAGKITHLVIAGGAPEGVQAELDLAKQFLPEESITVTGFLEDAALSDLLSRAEFGLSGQDWLSVEKSTTFMAYAAHGLNILSPYAGADSRAPFNWITGASELLIDDKHMEQKLHDRSYHLRQWYENTASWSAIAARMSSGFKAKDSALVDSIS